MNCPPPLGSPRFARGTEPRVHAVPPACRGNLKELVRVHRLSSLCARCARFFALTPSPSPTGWERGVEANGGSPNDRFPPRPLAGEGGKGGEGQKGALAPEISYLTPVPLSDLKEGVFSCARFHKLCPRGWYQTPEVPRAARRFNGHPPLGVNATLGFGRCMQTHPLGGSLRGFQWAPTLGGECYELSRQGMIEQVPQLVSMGTHPWG